MRSSTCIQYHQDPRRGSSTRSGALGAHPPGWKVPIAQGPRLDVAPYQQLGLHIGVPIAPQGWVLAAAPERPLAAGPTSVLEENLPC